jgi:hypothetical protein
VRVISGTWCQTSASTYHPIRCKTVNEHGRKQGKLTVRKLIRQMVRLSVDFSAGLSLVHLKRRICVLMQHDSCTRIQ